MKAVKVCANSECAKAGVPQSLEDFHHKTSAKDGHQSWCKACTAAAAKVRREANREKIAAQQKARYDANREKIVARSKAYRDANRETIAAREKAYRDANREKILAREKAYRDANREKILAQHAVYRNSFAGVLAHTRAHDKRALRHIEQQIEEAA